MLPSSSCVQSFFSPLCLTRAYKGLHASFNGPAPWTPLPLSQPDPWTAFDHSLLRKPHAHSAAMPSCRPGSPGNPLAPASQAQIFSCCSWPNFTLINSLPCSSDLLLSLPGHVRLKSTSCPISLPTLTCAFAVKCSHAFAEGQSRAGFYIHRFQNQTFIL